MNDEQLARAVADLTSGAKSRRAAAHEALLAAAEDPAMRPALEARLNPLTGHAHAEVRGTALLALATAMGAEALPLLERGASDPEPEVRSDLTHAASLLGEEGRPLLRKMVGDPVIEVAFVAAAALAELGDDAGSGVILAALERPGLRFQALSALISLGDPSARKPVSELFERLFLPAFERTAAAGVLARLGDEEARRWIVDRIEKKKGEDRGLAIEIAGDLRLAGATGALKAIAADRQDVFRGAALRSLGMMGDESLCADIARVLHDASEDPEVRMDAAEGLLHLGGPAARAELQRALAGAEPELKDVIQEALDSVEAPPAP